VRFRTGWFVESVVSASLVVLVIRTRGPALRSRPAWPLAAATLAVCVGAALLPATPLAGLLGFAALPPSFYALLAAIVATYVAAAELAKRWFHSGMGR
jgi:Mg2+-importing ATPase